MRKSSLPTMVLALVLALAAPGAVSADQPPETACFQVEEIGSGVLLEAIGTIEVGTLLQGEKSFTTYADRSGRFVADRSMKLLEDTLPLFSTNCMRAPAWGYAAGGRYPIVEQRGDFLRVVTDAERNQQVWINRVELAKAFYVEVRLVTPAELILAGLASRS